MDYWWWERVFVRIWPNWFGNHRLGIVTEVLQIVLDVVWNKDSLA